MKASVSPIKILRGMNISRGAMFAVILLVALLAFEVFNYSTTDFALTDLLGDDLKFMGVRWATILSIAFCGIDFAGIARLFTPEKGRNEPAEVWYLFGAWLLAAAMNATLTWWGVSVAINSHTPLGSAVLPRDTLLTGVPIFVAVLVWVIRLLLIGTFSIAGERIFSMAEDTYRPDRRYGTNQPGGNRPPMQRPTPASPHPAAYSAQRSTAYLDDDAQNTLPFRPSPKPEPSYHPLGASSSNNNNQAVRR